MAIIADAALTTALLTGRSDNPALASTTLTHCHIHKLTKDRLLDAPNFTSTLAGTTT